ncbi:DCC1-like thiol-disulfide oxidoreductase family protein [Halosquirtibacter laminarini]|uniref:DCC1-like thiol-disulfide oxidoreductase family protein n=1 Tax=Halosquirtibacter laminarini TaxID=3374600 RepID=A0AC61NE93_9BACT|nr:DCC1-like thiol-disulfide oxidoreductase family protein [Prolixibacteraceae bacterium]
MEKSYHADLLHPNNCYVFFDDTCMVCSFWVRSILFYEKSPIFYFAGLYDEKSILLFKKRDFQPTQDAVIVYIDGKWYEGIKAIFQITKRCRYPLYTIYCLRFIPFFITNFIYKCFAKLRWRPGKMYCHKHSSIDINRILW